MGSAAGRAVKGLSCRGWMCGAQFAGLLPPGGTKGVLARGLRKIPWCRVERREHLVVQRTAALPALGVRTQYGPDRRDSVSAVSHIADLHAVTSQVRGMQICENNPILRHVTEDRVFCF